MEANREKTEKMELPPEGSVKIIRRVDASEARQNDEKTSEFTNDAIERLVNEKLEKAKMEMQEMLHSTIMNINEIHAKTTTRINGIVLNTGFKLSSSNLEQNAKRLGMHGDGTVAYELDGGQIIYVKDGKIIER